MRIQNLRSPLLVVLVRIAVAEVAGCHQLGDGGVLEGRAQKDHVVLVEVVGRHVAAGLHDRSPPTAQQARQHPDRLELAGAGVSVLVIELAGLGDNVRVRGKFVSYMGIDHGAAAVDGAMPEAEEIVGVVQ